jgi:tetratricopeptide (TPR) repeat protein
VDRLEAQLLIWKAQALLSMGYPDRALSPASDSWHLSTSPHACNLMATALNAVGEIDRAEELLNMGTELFPEAVHLPVQLAMMQADQGRMPEALDTLDSVAPEVQLPDDMQIFLVGLRANLLATIGKWSEAEAVLEEGLGRHPDSPLLIETHDSISREWCRHRAEKQLEESWLESLEPLEGVPEEVDSALVRSGMVLELPQLTVLAARRLWRAFHARQSVRLQSPEAWSAALLLVVIELDGQRTTAAGLARATGANPSTVRTSRVRIRRYIDGLDPEFARRAFGAISNPRLDDIVDTTMTAGTVVRFPS